MSNATATTAATTKNHGLAIKLIAVPTLLITLIAELRAAKATTAVVIPAAIEPIKGNQGLSVS